MYKRQAIVLYVVMNKTTFGYELKACGYNRDGAKYAGMNEKRNLLLAMAIAGGLAAMGASIWCLNGHQLSLIHIYAGNDTPFIQKAGIGVALGNAKDDVREYADIVADTCANDGVAKVLEELGIV